MAKNKLYIKSIEFVQKTTMALTLILAFVLLQPAWAEKHATPALTEIPVTLFGQSCTLSGPLDQITLQKIHSISPEQLSPAQRGDQIRKVLEKVKKAAGLPPALDHYRERLIERLEALFAFSEIAPTLKKEGKPQGALLSLKKFLKQETASQEFETFWKKTEARVPASEWNTATLDQLEEIYQKAIEPNPEEDFHRAIRKLKIKYECAYEEGE